MYRCVRWIPLCAAMALMLLFLPRALAQLPLQDDWIVATMSEVQASGSTSTSPVVTIFNGKEVASNPGIHLGPTRSTPTLYHKHGVSPPAAWEWNYVNLGNVFGVALDKRKNIYLTVSTVYSPTTGPSSIHPGTIWQIDGQAGSATLGKPSVFATLPNTGPGLGNIDYDRVHDQFFVSNFEDGLIYRVSKLGVVGTTFNHGIDGLSNEGLPSVPDSATNGFTSLARRVWGVCFWEGRLFYSTWREDSGRPNFLAQNEIWSVAILSNGDFDPATARREIVLPSMTFAGTSPQIYSNPVSDICFSPHHDRMFVAERTRINDVGGLVGQATESHKSRVLEFPYKKNADGTYVFVATQETKFRCGLAGVGANAAGGVAVDIKGRPWVTSDYLYADTSIPEIVYGAERLPGIGNFGVPLPLTINSDVMVDLDDDVANYDKTYIGSLEIWIDPCISWYPVGPTTYVDPMNINAVRALSGPSGDRMYVGGRFSTIDGVAAQNIACFDGVSWSPLGPGLPFDVTDIEEFDDGTGPAIFASGPLAYGPNPGGGPVVPQGGVVRWNGVAWQTIGLIPSPASPLQHVFDMVVFDDGNGPALFVTGSGLTALDANGQMLADYPVLRYDGANWSIPGIGLPPGSPFAFNLGTKFDVSHAGGTPALLVAGLFTSGPGVYSYDGAMWTSVGAPIAGAVLTLKSIDAGPAAGIYVGGSGLGVLKLDVAMGQWVSLPGMPPTADVFALEALDDGTGTALYAGGTIHDPASPALSSVLRYDGVAWTSAGLHHISGSSPNAEAVTCLAAIPGEERLGLFVGAGTTYSGVPKLATGFFIDALAQNLGSFAMLKPCCPDITIQIQPVSHAAGLTTATTFTVTATSSDPLTYQWYKNGVLIPGATFPTLVIPSVAVTDYAAYQCLVMTDCRVRISATAILSGLPAITNGPGCVTLNGLTPTLTLSSAKIFDPTTISITGADPFSAIFFFLSPPTTPPLTGIAVGPCCPIYYGPASSQEFPYAATDALGNWSVSGTVPELPGYSGLMQAVVIVPPAHSNCNLVVFAIGVQVTNPVYFTIGY